MPTETKTPGQIFYEASKSKITGWVKDWDDLHEDYKTGLDCGDRAVLDAQKGRDYEKEACSQQAAEPELAGAEAKKEEVPIKDIKEKSYGQICYEGTLWYPHQPWDVAEYTTRAGFQRGAHAVIMEHIRRFVQNYPQPEEISKERRDKMEEELKSLNQAEQTTLAAIRVCQDLRKVYWGRIATLRQELKKEDFL